MYKILFAISMLTRRSWFQAFYVCAGRALVSPMAGKLYCKAAFFCAASDIWFGPSPLLCSTPSTRETRTVWVVFFPWGDMLNTARTIKRAHTLCCDQLALDNKLEPVSV